MPGCRTETAGKIWLKWTCSRRVVPLLAFAHENQSDTKRVSRARDHLELGCILKILLVSIHFSRGKSQWARRSFF